VQQKAKKEIELDGRTLQVSVIAGKPGSADGGWIIVLSDISDRKLAEYAIGTAEKLSASGKLASAIAHEINNPLEALINLIYLAESSDSVETIHDHLSLANHELERISRVTKQTLSFHRDTQKPVEINVGTLVGEVVGLFEPSASARGVKLVCELRPTPYVCGFPGQLSQVFGNLIRNAAEAGPRDSEVCIRVTAIHREGREGARVTIHDCGSGIPEHIQGKIFDPFFTTKALKGSGLGLWVSRTMILKHGGTIRFRTSGRPATTGTTFEVFLPVDGIASQPLEDVDAEDAVA
jgi:signal transduction histidine kinase